MWNDGSAPRVGQVLAETSVVGGGRTAGGRIRRRRRDEIEDRQFATHRFDPLLLAAVGDHRSIERRREPIADLRWDPQLGVGLGIRPRVAMVVRPTGRNESELVRDGTDRRDRRPIEGPVVDLEAAQSGVGELRDDRTTIGCLREVGQDRQPTGRPDGRRSR